MRFVPEDLKKELSIEFPSVENSSVEGLIYVGGELSVANLVEAYSRGIFPWPQEGYPMLWFCPPERGILEFSKIHISRSLAKTQKHKKYEFTCNQAFNEVIKNCSLQARPGQLGTWISDEVQEAYINFHKAGYAHSVECWDGERLVGGLYGVFVKGVFAGESMFYFETDASKLSLLYLCQELKRLGVSWMDTQMITPVLKAFGGELIDRAEYLLKLNEAQKNWLGEPLKLKTKRDLLK